MTATVDPGVISAVISAVGAILVTVIVAVVGIHNQRAARAAEEVARTQTATLGEIKVNVDGRLDAALAKIDHLEAVIANLTRPPQGGSPPTG